MVSKIRVISNPLADLKFEEFFTNPELYLCGKPVKELFDVQFFERLSVHAKRGFCYGLSALTMMLLRDDPSARLVQGWARGLRDGKKYRHAWVECTRDDKWYVVDMAWMAHYSPIPREKYYGKSLTDAEALWDCWKADFWRVPQARLLYQKCRCAETSWVLPQLALQFIAPGSDCDGDGVGFPDLSFEELMRLDSPLLGKTMVPPVFYMNRREGRPINAETILLLQRPTLCV